MGITSGFAVITAQRFGAKDENGVRRSVAMNIMLCIIIGLLCMVASLSTARFILRIINTPIEIFDDAAEYIIIIYIGIPATMLYNATACILRALGDSKSPLYFLIISSILNIILDIVLILYFDMGVAGAAWATVISQAFAGIISLIYMAIRFPILRIHRRDFTWDMWFAWQHLKIGLPMAFQFSITAIGVIILQGALNVFGPVKIAAYTAAQKVEQLVTAAASTFGVTMANYAGQNLGAKNINRIKAGTWQCSILSVLFSIFAMFVVFVFPEQLTSLFIKGTQPDVINASRTYLRICGTFFPVLFLLFIYRNVLQSIGRGFMPLMAGVAELAARTIASYTLPGIFGYAGICIAGPLAWIAATIPLAIAYFVIIKDFKIE